MARKFFYICAGMFLLALSYHFGASSAQAAVDHPVAIHDQGDCEIVVMSGGDVYGALEPRHCPGAQGAWQPRLNLFSAAGRGPSTIVGMSCFDLFMAANGDVFRIGSVQDQCDQIYASFDVNVFATIQPAAPGEEVAVFNGTYPTAYAVTNYGNIFRWFAPCGWDYVGALFGAPIVAKQQSWGQVKTRYR